jgi:hypothetical protein
MLKILSGDDVNLGTDQVAGQTRCKGTIQS